MAGRDKKVDYVRSRGALAQERARALAIWIRTGPLDLGASSAADALLSSTMHGT